MSVSNNRHACIINVTRKPSNCPDCGSEVNRYNVWYRGYDKKRFLLKYRKSVIMGGDFLVVLLYGVVQTVAYASEW